MTSEERRIAYQQLFDTEQGKLVMDDLRRALGADEKMHVIGDPYSTAFNDGRRSAWLYLTLRVNEPAVDERPATGEE